MFRSFISRESLLLVKEVRIMMEPKHILIGIIVLVIVGVGAKLLGLF